MQKAISIKEKLYDQLKSMRTDEHRSFTEVIQYLIKEKLDYDKWKKDFQLLNIEKNKGNL